MYIYEQFVLHVTKYRLNQLHIQYLLCLDHVLEVEECDSIYELWILDGISIDNCKHINPKTVGKQLWKFPSFHWHFL